MLDSFDINPAEQVRRVLGSVARAMRVCAESIEHEIVIRQFEKEISSAQPKANLVAIHTIPNMLDTACDTGLSKSLIEIGDHLPWTDSPRTPKMRNRIAVCSFNDMYHLERHIAGLLYMEPSLAYPEHAHAPPELYFTLSGTAEWRYGGSKAYQTVSAGNLLYNNSLDLHGVHSKETSLLAFFLLWGTELSKLKTDLSKLNAQ